MSEWRPEGWEETIVDLLDRAFYGHWDSDGATLINAGADAMLAALRKVGTKGEFYFNKIGEIECNEYYAGHYAGEDRPLSLFRKGTVIFIPDEKQC